MNLVAPRAAFIDTNVGVRYFIATPADQASKAAAIIEGQSQVLITLGTVAEIAFVLKSVYSVPREVIVDCLIKLLRRENVSVTGVSEEIVLQALEACSPSGRVSFADAMLWAEVTCSLTPRVYSFDKRFPAAGISVLRP